MLRAARPGDETRVDAFLSGYRETSMFLRGNLHAHGLDERDDPHGTAFWLEETGDQVTAVFGLSNAGFVMLQAPEASDALLSEFALGIAGQRVAGVTGDPDLAGRMIAALGLEDAAFALREPEPLYRLHLAALDTAGLGFELTRPPHEGDRALLYDWFLAYETELHMSPSDKRAAAARRRTQRALSCDCVRLLLSDGTPVAMTATNAALPDMVQVGGVYAPPAFRGKGYARTAVARHLEELRAHGVKTAILFASGPAASRAYEAIGFERIGSYALAILAQPQVIGGVAA